jgi:MSHA biogenesis protein MshI
MSLLTQVSNIFSKKQSNQLVGISLQQESVVLCSLSSFVADEHDSAQGVNFQKSNVNQMDFSEAIHALQADADLAGKCHIVLNAQQSQIVQVDKPSVPAAEINSALKWQIKDLVSIAPENMVLDYFDGPVLAGGQEKINVVCSPINELKKIVTAVNQGEMDVASITIAEFAFANLLPIQKEACLLVCQQPNEEIVLLIVKEGKLYFHRRLRGFSQIAMKTEDELAMTVIDGLALEIQRSSDYFERQLKQAPIKDIKVLLPIKSEGFFARKLAENSHIPVTLLALPEAYQAHREYAAAIGATMYDVRTAEQAQEMMNAS